MTSSYFESLGRGTTKPFSDPELDYLDTEPDLTEVVNKQIDKNIKDREQFFNDNIRMYNQTMQARSQRWNDLAKLTQSGKQIIQNRQAFIDRRDFYENLQKQANNPDLVKKYQAVEKDAQAETNANKVDINKEVSKVEKGIDQNGVGYDSSGEKFYPEDLRDLKSAVFSIDNLNGRAGINSMNLHWNQYLDIAKKSMTVNGKLFDQMTYSEKGEWFAVVAANYIGMYRDEDANISDGLLINKFVPTLRTSQKSILGQANATATAANNKVISDNQNFQNQRAIAAAWSNSRETGDQSYLVSEIYGPTGIIGQYEALYDGEPNAMALANTDFTNMVIDGINNKVIPEEAVYWLLDKAEFQAKGGGTTTYRKLQKGNATKIDIALKNQLITESKGDQQKYLDYLTGLADNEGTVITMDMISTIYDKDLRVRALDLVTRSSRGPINSDQFLAAKNELSLATYARAQDPQVFPNAAKGNAYVAQNNNFLNIAAQKYFKERYDYYTEKNQTEEFAQGEALKETIEKLNKGDFDKAVGDFGTYDKGAANLVVETTENVRKDPFGWLSAKTLHKGEQPYAIQAYEWFMSGGKGPVPAYYREISKLYKNKSAVQIMHDRLVATENMDVINNLDVETRVGLNNPYDVQDLTNKPFYSKTLRVALKNPENFGKLLTRITNPETVKNGGIDAIKDSEGQYTTLEKPLSEHNVVEVGDLLLNGYDGFGLYDMKGESLAAVLNYLVSNGYVTADQKFDEDFQKKIILTRLRLKSNGALVLDGDTSYRRLVDFTEEDKQKYKQIMGDIPPYMELDTLLPVVAKAKIEEDL